MNKTNLLRVVDHLNKQSETIIFMANNPDLDVVELEDMYGDMAAFNEVSELLERIVKE